MRTKILILKIIFLCLFILTNKIEAQEHPKSGKKVQKEVSKQRRIKEKEAKKADKKTIKAHYKAQGKKTSRRMKRNHRKSDKMKKNRRPFFIKSWFSYSDLELYKIEKIG